MKGECDGAYVWLSIVYKSFSLHFMMCRRRQVRNVYLRCGHAFNLPEEIIQCEESKCKFSLFHSSHCKPPVCLRTCWQYLQLSLSGTVLPYHQPVLPFLRLGDAIPVLSLSNKRPSQQLNSGATRDSMLLA
ncbi:hypothetical protein IW261DRAFT_1163930 [Armillaria novae-zelandiae]|uniref:Uncharacterized protein n=1 Tax=Armillaria novae-zelandiae TaxID=153914 RepID=A0AA39NFT1_9AGAR|nr:hypothetical protein IW261DRAFT_1163930 [Armillaria novae-zelandiae]